MLNFFGNANVIPCEQVFFFESLEFMTKICDCDIFILNLEERNVMVIFGKIDPPTLISKKGF